MPLRPAKKNKHCFRSVLVSECLWDLWRKTNIVFDLCLLENAYSKPNELFNAQGENVHEVGWFWKAKIGSCVVFFCKYSFYQPVFVFFVMRFVLFVCFLKQQTKYLVFTRLFFHFMSCMHSTTLIEFISQYSYAHISANSQVLKQTSNCGQSNV